jgi:hypothetical protein
VNANPTKRSELLCDAKIAMQRHLDRRSKKREESLLAASKKASKRKTTCY